MEFLVIYFLAAFDNLKMPSGKAGCSCTGLKKEALDQSSVALGLSLCYNCGVNLINQESRGGGIWNPQRQLPRLTFEFSQSQARLVDEGMQIPEFASLVDKPKP